MRAQYRILVGAGAVAIKRSRAFYALFWLTTSVSAGTAWAGGYPLEQEATTTVPVGEQHRITVNNSRGSTVIVGRSDATSVAVKAVKIVRGAGEEDARRLIRELDYRISSDDNEILIETIYPEHLNDAGSFWSFLRGTRYTVQIEYMIEVPMEFEARVSSSSGDVEVTSLRGDVKVTNSSGDVLLRGLGRRAFVELASGYVEVESVEGDVRVRLASGDMLATNIGGRLDVRATSGDVEVYDIDGDADVEVASGNVLIRGCVGDTHAKAASGDCVLSSIGGNVRATTASGDIDLSLSPQRGREYVVTAASGDVRITFQPGDNTGFLLDVNTQHGTIEGDLDIQLEKVTRSVLQGKVGKGDGHLYIETASGNIRIHQSERRN